MCTGIYDIPAEILAVIFEEGKHIVEEMPPAPDDGRSHRSTPFEILITHICSYFRQVSLATPSLWTSIRVDAFCRIENIVDRLERSGACGLNIRIESAGQDTPINATMLDMIMDHILRHSLRWRSLFLRYAYERAAHPVVRRICAAPAPRLRSFSLTVDNVNEADLTSVNRSVNRPHIFNDGTPQELKFVRLRGLATQLFRPSLNSVVTLHLDQVRYLPLQYSTLREILMCSLYLANLSIYGDIIAPGTWPPAWQANTLYLPNLRSLRLFSESGETCAGVMNGLDAPKLESLTLKSLHEHDMDDLWNIPNQNARFPNLKSLTFEEFDFTDLTYGRIFQTFSGITSFFALCIRVKDSPLLKILGQGLTVGPDGSPYIPWPRLETLGFATEGGDGAGVIDAVVEARKTCGYPISTFLFAVCGEDEAEEELLLEYQGRRDLEIKFCPTNIVWPEDRTHLDYEDCLF